MNILFVFHLNFLKQRMGCENYCFNIVKTLKSQGFHIDFFAKEVFSHDYDDFKELNEKNGNLIDNLYVCYRNFSENRRKYNYGSDSLCNDEMIDYFREIVSNNKYEYICVNYVEFLDLIKNSSIPYNSKVVCIMHDFKAVQKFYRNRRLEDVGQNINEELKMISCCDSVICISIDEYQFFSRFFLDKSFFLLPHCMESKNLVCQEKDIDCLFVGWSNPYNRDAVIWFIDYVYPHLTKGINITICGKVVEQIQKQKPQYYEKMEKLGFNLIKFSQDLDGVHARTKVVIVPMLEGTGLKIKTVSAMSYGIPVVSTELGVDGFLDKTESGCLVSNDPKFFANNINNLLKNESLYAQCSSKIKNYFNKHFSVDVGNRKIKQIFPKSAEYVGKGRRVIPVPPKISRRIDIYDYVTKDRLQKIFSIRNEYDGGKKMKIITLFGLKLKIKVKNKI